MTSTNDEGAASVTDYSRSEIHDKVGFKRLGVSKSDRLACDIWLVLLRLGLKCTTGIHKETKKLRSLS